MSDNDKKLNVPPSVSIISLIKKADEMYAELKSTVEPTQNGKYLALDVESGDYAIGDTREEAVSEIKKTHPNVIPLTRRIGELEKASRHISRHRPQYAIC